MTTKAKSQLAHFFTILAQKCYFLVQIGEYTNLILETIKVSLRKFPRFSLIMEQMYQVGVASLPVVAITGFSTGIVLAAQSFYQLEDKGLSSVTGLIVAKAMMTELGPVMTAFMLTGRVGASMCAELGTMKVTEQIDALRTMAVNPFRYLIAPRFLSGIVMMPLLTVFCIIMGIFGGYLISIYFFEMSHATYFDSMPVHIELFDLFTGIIKAVFFGAIILSISCYKGMMTQGGAAGVGRFTTNSVVITYCSILLVNFFLTVALNVIREGVNKYL